MAFECSGLEPRHVEQVGDDPVETRRLLPDGGDERGVVALFELDLVARQRVRARDDGGQRGAQVVRHRAQQRGLDDVAVSQRLRLERLGLEGRAIGRDGEQGRQRRQEPLRDRRIGRVALIGEQRGDTPEPRVDRNRELPVRGRRVAELDARRAHVQCDRGEVGELVELCDEIGAAQQVARSLGENVSFAAPLFRILLAMTRARGERAHDDGRHEVHGEHGPVGAVAQLERMRRRQEEPVEGEHARDRDDRREHRPPADGDRKHREHVQNAEAQHGHVRPEHLDRERDDRDRPCADEQPDGGLHEIEPASSHATTVEDAARRRASARPFRSGSW